METKTCSKNWIQIWNYATMAEREYAMRYVDTC